VARQTREIEDILKKASVHPNAIMIICEIAERMKVQHSQINELAATCGRLADMLIDTQRQMGGLGGKLDKLGITDKIKSMDNQDDEPDDTHSHSRRRNN
jgi:hypothetical protein